MTLLILLSATFALMVTTRATIHALPARPAVRLARQTQNAQLAPTDTVSKALMNSAMNYVSSLALNVSSTNQLSAPAATLATSSVEQTAQLISLATITLLRLRPVRLVP